MLGNGALSESALSALSDADDEAPATPFLELLEAPTARRIYLLEIYAYQPEEA